MKTQLKTGELLERTTLWVRLKYLNRKGVYIRRIDLTNQRFGKLTVCEMLYGYKKEGTKKPLTYCRCKCDCGKEKIILASNLKKGVTVSCGCFEEQSRYNRKHYTDLVGRRFKHLTVVDKTNKKAANGCVVWKCKCDCGNYREVPSSDLTKGRTISCGCKNFDSVKIDITNERYGKLKVIKRYEGTKFKRTAWICKCDCGKEKIVKTTDLRTGNTQSCGECCDSKSIPENFIGILLEKNNVEYFYNYRFSDCIAPDTHRELPFDFYLPKFNLVIEYDGRQHYVPIDYFGGRESFSRRLYLDKIKDNFCQCKNIRIIRIPYTCSFKEIEKLILDILDPATTTAV